MDKKTEDLLITENHLLLPIIWEGNLNIHSNEPLMKKTHFQNIILHGDTIFSLATALVEKKEAPFTFLNEFHTIYKSSVTVGDKIFVEYGIISCKKQNKVDFSVFKNERELVMDGILLFTSLMERS